MNPSIIIGQKLNAGGSRRVATALCCRDGATVKEIARRQVADGAALLDLCASGVRDEREALVWLVRTVQEAVDVPLSLDSADVAVVREVVPLCRRASWLNVGFGGTGPQAVELGAALRERPGLLVVAACREEARIDLGVAGRLEAARRVMRELEGLSVGISQVVFDPVLLPMSAGQEAWAVTLETMALLRRDFPDSRILCAVGNYSYGLRAKGKAEHACVEAARAAGADVFLCDPGRVRVGCGG